MSKPIDSRKKVIIIGAGFGGINAAKTLKNASFSITVIDQYNYHLFQPLLYQVATAGLSPADISVPIRQVLSRQKNCQVIMDRVIDVDADQQKVMTKTQNIDYDYLIVATGARHSYFGNDDWQTHAPGLKNINDATLIREKILLSLEQAEMCKDPKTKQSLMTFCIIGAGPTGVEMAGAISELTKKTLSKDFRNINPESTRVVLLEAGDKVLSNFPENLSKKAHQQLIKLGVEVKTQHLVTHCSSTKVMFDQHESIACNNIIWAAGVQASSAQKWLRAKGDKAQRVCVNGYLALPEHNNVFVIGDTAFCKDVSGQEVPGVAPAAKQMGRYVAQYLLKKIKYEAANSNDLSASAFTYKKFKYKNYGNLATIGRKAAVADFHRFTLSGFAAWFMWSFTHVFFLIGFRNRLTVMLNWAWHYFSFARGARLITKGKNSETKKPDNTKIG